MSRFKKFLVLGLVGLMMSVQLITPFSTAHAAEYWYRQGFFSWYTRVYDTNNPSELFGERYTAAQVQWIFYSIGGIFISMVDNESGDLRSCIEGILNGIGLGDIVQCGTYILFLRGSVQGQGNAIQQSPLAEVFSPKPISAITYVQDAASKFHVVPEAHAQAQGAGFEAGEVVRKLWKGSRDIAYFLIVLAMIVMAFMIMFRVKISPQVVITIQSAIPKIIITLLLITFSYAIAGLMIDLMYVVMGIMTTLVRSAGLIDTAASPDWAATFGELTHNNSIVKLMLAYLGISIVAIIWTLISNIGSLILSVASLGLLPLIVILIFLIVVLYLMIKITFMLVKNYVFIILKIAFGPLEILAGVFGGGGFAKWLKGLGALLAVYPATGFLFILSFIFLRGALSGGGLGAGSNLYPFDVAEIFNAGTSWSPPLTGTEDMNLVWLFASLAILMLIPKVPDMIKSALQGREFGYGTAISEGFAPAMGVANYPKAAARSEIGFRAGKIGQQLQETYEHNTSVRGRVSNAVGRGLVSFGEGSGALGIRDREGNLTSFKRRGQVS